MCTESLYYIYLFGNLFTVFPGHLGTLLIRNLSNSFNTIGPWHRDASWNRNGLGVQDWDLVAHLIVDRCAFLAVSTTPIGITGFSLNLSIPIS
jgi:hypothetical protein